MSKRFVFCILFQKLFFLLLLSHTFSYFSYFPLQVNPPYFLPLVEIVPAGFTKPEVAAKVRSLMEDIGQSPITLRRESLGFALNRIQYACINEAWNMYKVRMLSFDIHIPYSLSVIIFLVLSSTFQFQQEFALQLDLESWLDSLQPR